MKRKRKDATRKILDSNTAIIRNTSASDFFSSFQNALRLSAQISNRPKRKHPNTIQNFDDKMRSSRTFVPLISLLRFLGLV